MTVILYQIKWEMQTAIILMIIASTIITTIVNFAKPAYKDLVGKRETTINIGLSFVLGICSAFAIAPYMEIEIWVGATILIWLALWTWSTVFYDLWRLIQNIWSKTKITPEDELPSTIWFYLDNEEKDEWQDSN